MRVCVYVRVCVCVRACECARCVCMCVCVASLAVICKALYKNSFINIIIMVQRSGERETEPGNDAQV